MRGDVPSAALEPAPQSPADSPCAAPLAADDAPASAAAAAYEVSSCQWRRGQSSTSQGLAASGKPPRGVACRHAMVAALGIALLWLVVRCIWIFGQVLTSCFTSFWGSNPVDPQGAGMQVSQFPPPSAVQGQKEAQQQGWVTSSSVEHMVPEEQGIQELIFTHIGGPLSEPLPDSKPQQGEESGVTGGVTLGQPSFLGLVLSQVPAPSLLDSSSWPSGNFWPTASHLPQQGAHAEQQRAPGAAGDPQPQEGGDPPTHPAQEGVSAEQPLGDSTSPVGAAARPADAAEEADEEWDFETPGSPWTPEGNEQPAGPVGGWGREVQPFYGVPQGEPYVQPGPMLSTLASPSPFDFGISMAVTQSLSRDSGGDDTDLTTS
ncbi:hypothetical protein Esti_004511 [Eimeria stiedai]